MTDAERKAAEESRQFTRRVNQSAGRLLIEWVGEARAREAKGRITSAFSSAALSARDPSDFYKCTAASVAQCVAISALTGIMPSTGATALAYLIPRRPRKGEEPQLQYQLSHRGIAALASRAGMILIPVPIGYADHLIVRDGEIYEHEGNPDEPPMYWDELRGVALLVKDRATGVVLYRGWVAKVIIEKRRDMSDSFHWAEGEGDWAKERSTWHKWGIEMAMKTAMHYAIGRGWAIIDDTEAVRALSMDVSSDVIDIEADDITPATSKLLEDHEGLRDAPDFDKLKAELAAKEKAEVEKKEGEKPAEKKLPPTEDPATSKSDKMGLVDDCLDLEKDLPEEAINAARMAAGVDASKKVTGKWKLSDLRAYRTGLQDQIPRSDEGVEVADDDTDNEGAEDAEMGEPDERQSILEDVYTHEARIHPMKQDELRDEHGIDYGRKALDAASLATLQAYLDAVRVA